MEYRRWLRRWEIGSVLWRWPIRTLRSCQRRNRLTRCLKLVLSWLVLCWLGLILEFQTCWWSCWGVLTWLVLPWCGVVLLFGIAPNEHQKIQGDACNEWRHRWRRFPPLQTIQLDFLWLLPKYKGRVNPVSRAGPIFRFMVNPVFGWRASRRILQTWLLIGRRMFMTLNILNVNPVLSGYAVSIVPWNFLINSLWFKPWWIV